MDNHVDEHECHISAYGCRQCEYLMEALREFEAQCREAEDNCDLQTGEEAYLARLRKLEHRRDCALEVLLRHQAIEHSR
jgi:hypothetical protein